MAIKDVAEGRSDLYRLDPRKIQIKARLLINPTGASYDFVRHPRDHQSHCDFCEFVYSVGSLKYFMRGITCIVANTGAIYEPWSEQP